MSRCHPTREQSPVGGQHETSARTWYCQYGKRALDLGLGLVGFTILVALFLPIALAIRLESPGPVLFRQLRKGRHQQPFTLLKFRSMRTDAPFMSYRDAAHQATRYVTRVGALLRRTSLDELPQFLNVMRGDMSLIGPRPESLNAIPYEGDEIQRFMVRPGITGLAQVRGRNAVEIQARRALDVEYARAVTLRQDLWILGRTLLTVVRRDNIYSNSK